MKIKTTIAALAITALTTMPTIAKPEAALREYKPSVKARELKRNKKLERKIQGVYTYIAGGSAMTLDIPEVICHKNNCLFSYEIRQGGGALMSNVGYANGNRIFFTEYFIDGHALMTAQVKKQESVLSILGYIDGDCIVEWPYSLCDHSVEDVYLDTGRFFKRD